jgi:hypothetical protein
VGEFLSFQFTDVDQDSDDGLKDTTEFKKYLADLQSAGFFGGELQGSEKWKEREIEAVKGWKSIHADE